jgi:hypothetical protein
MSNSQDPKSLLSDDVIPNPPIIWTTSNGEAATPGSANLPIGIIIKLRSQRSSFIHIIP